MEYWYTISIEDGYLDGARAYYIYQNLQYIANRLSEAGIGEVILLNCDMWFDFELYLMDKFNMVEQNIDNLHNLADYKDVYYKEPFRWSMQTDMRVHLLNGVKRWIDWLNDAKKHRDGEFETEVLIDKDGIQITDKDGNNILIFKEW